MTKWRSYKILFFDDHLLSEFYFRRTRAFNPKLTLLRHYDIGHCLSEISKTLEEEDLVWFNFHFFDEMVPPFLGAWPPGRAAVYLVSSQDYKGIGIDVVKFHKDTNKPEEIVFEGPYLSVANEYYTGIQLKKNTKQVLNGLLSRLGNLQIVKSFLPLTRDYLSFSEFLDFSFSRILRILNAPSGHLKFWYNETGKQIFSKHFGEHFHEELILTPRVKLPANQLVVIPVHELDNKEEVKVIQSVGYKTCIASLIESRAIQGNFKVWSILDKIGEGHLEILKAFGTQLRVFLDNTVFMQDLLGQGQESITLFQPQETGIMVVDSLKRVVEIDSVAEMLCGWGKSEALGKPCRDLWLTCDYFGTPICDSQRCIMDRALSQIDGRLSLEVRTVTRSGDKRVLRSNWAIDTSGSGEVKYGKTVIRDLTQRFSLQERFSRLEQMAGLGKFASELAHEIRNPVTGISSNAQFLYQSGDLKQEHKAIIEEIIMGAKMLERMVKKYLVLAKPIEPKLERCDLNSIVAHVSEVLASRMKHQYVAIESDFHPDLPQILADGDQLQQVFFNVILNAIEAMPDGGKIRVTTSCEEDSGPSTAFRTKKVVLSISDTGVGIGPKEKERVFDAFYTTKAEGTGLGLYTSLNILKQHDAEIRILSELGRGTEVLISFLPIKQ